MGSFFSNSIQFAYSKLEHTVTFCTFYNVLSIEEFNVDSSFFVRPGCVRPSLHTYLFVGFYFVLFCCFIIYIILNYLVIRMYCLPWVGVILWNICLLELLLTSVASNIIAYNILFLENVHIILFFLQHEMVWNQLTYDANICKNPMCTHQTCCLNLVQSQA